MSLSIAEQKENIENLLDNMSISFFENYEFTTSKGFSSNCFSDFASFTELLGAYQSEFSESYREQIISEIRKSLYPIIDGIRTKDFDWDEFEGYFDECIEKNNELSEILEQVEEVLFVNQTIEDIELLDQLELMDLALEYLKNKDLIQVVNTPDGEMYLASNELKIASL